MFTAKRVIFWYLILSVLVTSLPSHTYAIFVPSDRLAGRNEDMEQIRKVLEEKLMSQRLLDLGLTPQQVHERMAALSDGQIHSLTLRLKNVKVGGAAEGVLIGILVIIIVILVVLPLTGIRVWFDGKT